VQLRVQFLCAGELAGLDEHRDERAVFSGDAGDGGMLRTTGWP
jgi:hypothetical protein